jgi:hypothetical protein
MTRLLLSLAVLSAALAPALPAQAQSLTRTFVSAAGNDGNACTVAAPCRTFVGAYAKTQPSGVIAVLDPAGYGSLTITGPVTIDGRGWASITVPASGAGITVNAGINDNVILRGLNIDGANAAGTTGIAFNIGGSLTVDDCVVRNVVVNGLYFGPTGTATLEVSDSTFIGAGNGIEVDNTHAGSAAVTAAVLRTGLDGNSTNGVLGTAAGGTGAVTVAVTDSVAANGGTGFQAVSAGGQGAATVILTRATAASNLTGITSGTNATLWLAESTITGNTTAGFSATGVINTFQNNYFADNGSNSGTLIQVGTQ